MTARAAGRDGAPAVRLRPLDPQVADRLVVAAAAGAAPGEVFPAPAGASAWTPALRDAYRSFLAGRDDGFAIEAAGEAAGFVRLTPAGAATYETGIWLRRASRGRGAGTAALRVVVELARGRGAALVVAETTAANGPALGALARSGAVLEGAADGRVRASWRVGRAGDVVAELTRLELLFLRLAPGATTEQVQALIADDFSEIGASGRRHDRAAVLAILRARLDEPAEDRCECSDFAVRELAPDVHLLTYACDRPGRRTLRSTIWRRTADGWRAEFHQGTPAPPGADGAG